jgi:hypothetical protein
MLLLLPCCCRCLQCDEGLIELAEGEALPVVDATLITYHFACATGRCLQGDEGLIELAEGETLPVVDEAGNTLGTLHADGRVLDDAGQEIGMLDDDGNVVLFEQQAAEGEF